MFSHGLRLHMRRGWTPKGDATHRLRTTGTACQSLQVISDIKKKYDSQAIFAGRSQSLQVVHLRIELGQSRPLPSGRQKRERNAPVVTVPVFMGPLLTPMSLLVFFMCWFIIFNSPIRWVLMLFLTYRRGNWGMKTRVLLDLAVITPRTPCLGNSDSQA